MGIGSGRRTFTQEFKEDAVRLVTDRGVPVAHAAQMPFIHRGGTGETQGMNPLLIGVLCFELVACNSSNSGFKVIKVSVTPHVFSKSAYTSPRKRAGTGLLTVMRFPVAGWSNVRECECRAMPRVPLFPSP